ncbi:Crp/Fnr family transcriptional regulator [Aurantiacibacter gangjinensis]|uniref:Transcriptional regulator n=1 Tax=Aurantiacibacter gangjinensis TaxID=502682 RepID=A0A0G9MS64_9SPHN|nr:Crp/Fnr family transcriptional regulator [Aurantiacibacter gangjinensis]APE28214.1 transcriptional regulator, Crp/Fnr family [Aurantiacibacter gangjinensis]KLE32113.1 transcriptional regulator [Aurantiacibacter gangjinensis]
MTLECATCPVRDSAACAVLSEEDREKLARAGRTRELSRGEVLFAAGEADTVCATLLTGALKVTSHDADGHERILALIHPSGFIGEMFSPFTSHDVVALTKSRLCIFAKADMEAALERHPELLRALLRRSQEDLHRSRMLLSLGSGRSAQDQVGGLLLALAQAASTSPCHPARTFELPITRGEMASMLGLTIETVSRAITTLEREGTIRRNGTRGIELVDPARLEDLV